MPTTIDSMTGMEIKSPFFDTPVLLELFPARLDSEKGSREPQKKRVALIYGANGSGKSTIARGVREYAESITPRTVELTPTVKASVIKMSSEMRPGKFFVFDEEYITHNIKMQENGLGTIVLLGKQVELERRLEELKIQILETQNNIDSKNEFLKQFSLESSVMSPLYWNTLIIKKLQEAGGWAETSGISIKRKHIKTRVTDVEIERLGQLSPRKDEASTRAEFNDMFGVFNGIETSALPVTPQIRPIEVPESVIASAQQMLAKVPQEPELTGRERELLQIFGIEVLSNAKGFLSAESHEICPTCLQSISETHRMEALRQIDDILNREVEEYRSELRKLILPEIVPEQYQRYSVLDSELLGQAILQIISVNALIVKHNGIIQSKIAAPLSRMEYSNSTDLIIAYKQLNDFLEILESKREAFNRVATNRRATEKELLKLNDEIAHYAINNEYQSLRIQRDLREKTEKELHQLFQMKNDLTDEQQRVDAQRKNLQIAVEQINRSLSYIFYSDSRLKLHLEGDQMYHLTVNGKEVSPDKISCGERNALALSYFFTEIARGTELQRLYCDEMFLVIDDPVSSFDVENRVGILSFLRYKLGQVLSSCATTKILMMTHDVSVMFDLQKTMAAISANCAGIGKHAGVSLFQLSDKKLAPFRINSHNEYTRIMRCVYEYGCNPDPAMELTIGNMTRRVLEAFSTFTFKVGVEKISADQRVLNLIPVSQRAYFQNSMYRVVLNTESHFEEAAQGAPEINFFSHLSVGEKQRTARDILCFMYCVNPAHVLAHLPNAEGTLNEWMKKVK